MTLPPPPLPPSVIDQVRKTLLAMKKASGEGAGAERFKVAAQTMLKYIGNIAASPEEEKYRCVYVYNGGGTGFGAGRSHVPLFSRRHRG